ncbi:MULTISPECIES: SLC13 family permease [Clostridium]|uniref:SLC13 family permease n=1 Tax=Clostridium frigoriphilum TaxID=443253 RepID=A0ABU7UUZ6_9CLOT|nr:SLC13 family permease [Clostridium sp. DSM 17811]MBU3102213.1 hypothetical protein [Clostridium sp. DSM 17811]
MSYALISIIGLILAIVIGVKRKVNVGVISLFFAFVLSFFVFNMKIKTVYAKGWPVGIFFIMMAAMFLFSFANVNGTTKLLAEKLAYAIKGNVRILPLVFFLATVFMTACGADPSIAAFMLPVALYIGEEAGMKPIILCVSIIAGADVGGCSPIAVIGIVTSGLAAKGGVTNYWPIWAATATTMILLCIIVYFVFGGYKVKTVVLAETAKPQKFNVKQLQTLCTVLFVICLIIFVKVDIGGAAFIGVAIMLMLGTANEKEAIKSINWNVLIMVGGTGVLVYVMTEVGGVKMLGKFLASVMTKHTAAPLMAILAGAMTSVSSATGVVMPALFPTIPSIVKEMHGAVSPIELMQVLQAGSLGSVSYSPLSALGAMAMATIPEHVNKEKLFTQLLIMAVAGLALTVLLSFLGVFRLFI